MESSACRCHLKGGEFNSQYDNDIFVLCPVYTACGSRVMLIHQKSISKQYVLKKLHTLLYCAYFHVYQINNGFIIYNDFKNLILEVLHDIISNSTHFRRIQYGGWQPSWIC